MKRFLVKFLSLIIGLTIFLLFPKEEWNMWAFAFYGASILSTSIIGHSIYKKYYWRAVLFTIIVSSIVFTFGAILVGIIQCYSVSIEKLQRNLPDIIKWSPLMLWASFIQTLPIAFPISMIVGDIFKWHRGRKKKR